MRLVPGSRSRFALWTLFAALAVCGILARVGKEYLDSRPISWQRFSRTQVQRETVAGHHVLVSFYADWDLSSVRIHVTIDTSTIRALLRQKDVIPMRADYSKADSEIRSELASLGHNSVPANGDLPSIRAKTNCSPGPCDC